jgi:hypothetical protein
VTECACPARCLLYLGISGVLHPSRTTYRLLHSREPEEDGHQEFEGAATLERILAPCADLYIVLTSTHPRKHGLAGTLDLLGPSLSSRVQGWTFEDLTTKVRVGPRARHVSKEDYWRKNTSEIVRTHVEWARPLAWLALSDDSILWNTQERASHFIEVDGDKGLKHDLAAQQRLAELLARSFSY